ncbi:hypothetical protein QEG73_07900 [Chitinophagaceae bacterium 26-R-25]|nr:hypothetical protein [Chitinophagaceae bacterium 26-R-25]
MTSATAQEIPVKPSKQIEEVSKWWLKSVAASRESQSLAEVRDINENWQSLTSEPGSVDYIEVDAGGVQAMWAIPKESFGDRVLLCVGEDFSADPCIRTENCMVILPKESDAGR